MIPSAVFVFWRSFTWNMLNYRKTSESWPHCKRLNFPLLAALERAVTLVQRNGARLTVVDAVVSLPRDVSTTILRETSEELYNRFTLERQKELVQQIFPIIGSGLHPNVTVLVGTRFVEIIGAVLRNEHDLVMMTAEGYGGVNCSVLTVKPEGFVSPVSPQDT
jgi:hypothetical protein